jgi:hypothetical protein
VKYVNTHIFLHLTWLSQKHRGWWRKTTYIFEFSVKSSIRNKYFPRVPKKVKFCCPVKYVNIHIFSHLTWLSQKQRGWWRKTNYIFEFSVKSSIRIRHFSSWDKKKVKFCWPVLLVHLQLIRSSDARSEVRLQFNPRRLIHNFNQTLSNRPRTKNSAKMTSEILVYDLTSEIFVENAVVAVSAQVATGVSHLQASCRSVSWAHRPICVARTANCN